MKNLPKLANKNSKFWKNSPKKETSVFIDFKNSFARLTGIKQLIFCFNEFFGSGHFLVLFQDIMDQKNDRSQKSYKSKKSLFSCPSTTWRNVYITEKALFSQLFYLNFEQLFPSFTKFFENNLWLKSLFWWFFPGLKTFLFLSSKKIS